MEIISITSAYSILDDGKQINGTIPVYGAIGYSKLPVNGVDLYVLHTAVTKDSYESNTNLQFIIQEGDPIINGKQLYSLKEQLKEGRKELCILRGLLTKEEGEALSKIEPQKMELCRSYAHIILHICAK